jgi:hypothetical protein
MNLTSNNPDIRPAGLIFHLIIQEDVPVSGAVRSINFREQNEELNCIYFIVLNFFKIVRHEEAFALPGNLSAV